ncbi:MAG: mercury transporter MerT [Acidobacteria bacterium]|nr:mercury transporter MerT [Acidobacteriota bacterium]
MRNGFLAATGAVLSAILGSLCCFGPFVAAALGITGAGFTQWFKPYRPWLAGIAAALIGLGFYAVYGRSSIACSAEGASCQSGRGRRWQKLALWLAAGAALLLLLFPYYIPLIT